MRGLGVSSGPADPRSRIQALPFYGIEQYGIEQLQGNLGANRIAAYIKLLSDVTNKPQLFHDTNKSGILNYTCSLILFSSCLCLKTSWALKCLI